MASNARSEADDVTVFHVFYIPAIFLLGVAIGAYVGKRNTLRELAARERAERERAERRAAREAAR